MRPDSRLLALLRRAYQMGRLCIFLSVSFYIFNLVPERL
jgi:hypothetical protein